jgi:hypothetical protein
MGAMLPLQGMAEERSAAAARTRSRRSSFGVTWVSSSNSNQPGVTCTRTRVPISKPASLLRVMCSRVSTVES